MCVAADKSGSPTRRRPLLHIPLVRPWLRPQSCTRSQRLPPEAMFKSMQRKRGLCACFRPSHVPSMMDRHTTSFIVAALRPLHSVPREWNCRGQSHPRMSFAHHVRWWRAIPCPYAHLCFNESNRSQSRCSSEVDVDRCDCPWFSAHEAGSSSSSHASLSSFNAKGAHRFNSTFIKYFL